METTKFRAQRHKICPTSTDRTLLIIRWELGFPTETVKNLNLWFHSCQTKCFFFFFAVCVFVSARRRERPGLWVSYVSLVTNLRKPQQRSPPPITPVMSHVSSGTQVCSCYYGSLPSARSMGILLKVLDGSWAPFSRFNYVQLFSTGATQKQPGCELVPLVLVWCVDAVAHCAVFVTAMFVCTICRSCTYTIHFVSLFGQRKKLGHFNPGVWGYFFSLTVRFCFSLLFTSWKDFFTHSWS